MENSTEKIKKLLLQKLSEKEIDEVVGGKRLEIPIPKEALTEFSPDEDGMETESAVLVLEQDEDDKEEACCTIKLKIRVLKNNNM